MKYLMDKAHTEAYNILAEYRDYLDLLAEKLLEKETLRRPDLEALFDGITPREVGEVFPDEDVRFPRQAGREPVKTPTELAIERGEEPPKPFSLLEASKAARAKRAEELAAGQMAVPQPTPPTAAQSAPQSGPQDVSQAAPGAVGPNPKAYPTEMVPVVPSDPDQEQTRYAGTPPPAGWTVPGDKATNPYASQTTPQPQPQPVAPTEEIGFRLPENERTENPWNDEQSKDEEKN